VQLLLFLVSTTEKYFGRVLTTFPGSGITGAGKVDNRARTTWFSARNILTLFRVQLLSFPISTAKQCFGRLLKTFPGPGTSGAGTKEAKLITEPEWPVFAPETYPHCLGAVLMIFGHYSWKMFQSTFDVFSRPGYHRSTQSWKSGPNDSVLHPKHTHTVWGVVLIIFISATENCFRQILTIFSGTSPTWAGKVENQALMT